MTEAIKLIVLDVDGTLLNSEHNLSERNEKALKAAMQQGVQVVLATGKTRTATQDLIERLGLTTPGIYVQGLRVYNGDGSLRYQHTLDSAIARQVINFAEDRGFVVAAYSGEKILARANHKLVENMTRPYHEVDAEAIGPLQNILDGTPINKVIALGPQERIKALRWQLSMQINGSATFVQASEYGSLEVLPPHTSKGAALKKLLQAMEILPQQVLAMGDAENDVEMVKLAGVGLAVANAQQLLKDVADHVVASNDDDAVAQAIERFVTQPAAEKSAAQQSASATADETEQPDA